MIKFFAGVVVGIVIATVGVTGLFAIADRGVEQAKEVAKEAAQK